MKKFLLFILLFFSFKSTRADSKIADLYYPPQWFINQVLNNWFIQDIIWDSSTNYTTIYDFYWNKISRNVKWAVLFLNLWDKQFDFNFDQQNDWIYFNILKMFDTWTWTEVDKILWNDIYYELDYTPTIKIWLSNDNLIFCFQTENNDSCKFREKFNLINDNYTDYTWSLTGNDLLPFIDNIDIRNIKIAKKIIKLNDNWILYKKADNNIYKFITEENNSIWYEDTALQNTTNAKLINFKWIYNGINQFWSLIYETGTIIKPVTYITDNGWNLINTQDYYIVNYLTNWDIWKLYNPTTMGINYTLWALEPNIWFIHENWQDFKFTYSSGSELWYTNPDTTNFNIIGSTAGWNIWWTTWTGWQDYPTSISNNDLYNTLTTWDTDGDGSISISEFFSWIWNTIKSFFAWILNLFDEIKKFIWNFTNIWTNEVKHFSFITSTYANESDVWGKLNTKIWNNDNFTWKFVTFAKWFLFFIFFIVTLLVFISIKKSKND